MVDFSADFIRSILDYDPETGIFRWRSRPELRKERDTRRAGKVAGGPNTLGYISIRIENKLMLAHRLAWLHMTGNWPAKNIDHANGDPSDNRWCNLREATQAQNLRNVCVSKNNKSGFLGVDYRPTQKLWRARISRNREIVWIGYFASAQEASAARRAEIERIDGEFATKRDHRLSSILG